MKILSTINHHSRAVGKRPICQFCLEEAEYEGRTVYGTWASMCRRDFKRIASNSGQKLLLIERLSVGFRLRSAAPAYA